MRKKRSAVELVSAMGSLGFDLQHCSDAEISDAVIFLRKVNPEMFDWLSTVLGTPTTAGAVRLSADQPGVSTRAQ